MQEMKQDFRPPLAKAAGLGAARSGSGHFWLQRLTAMANIPLIIFFVWLLVKYLGRDYTTVHNVLACPMIAVLMLLMIVSSIYHMKLGLQVIIEDYVPQHSLRAFLLILNIMFCWAIAIACIISVLKINFGG